LCANNNIYCTWKFGIDRALYTILRCVYGLFRWTVCYSELGYDLQRLKSVAVLELVYYIVDAVLQRNHGCLHNAITLYCKSCVFRLGVSWQA